MENILNRTSKKIDKHFGDIKGKNNPDFFLVPELRILARTIIGASNIDSEYCIKSKPLSDYERLRRFNAGMRYLRDYITAERPKMTAKNVTEYRQHLRNSIPLMGELGLDLKMMAETRPSRQFTNIELADEAQLKKYHRFVQREWFRHVDILQNELLTPPEDDSLHRLVIVFLKEIFNSMHPGGTDLYREELFGFTATKQGKVAMAILSELDKRLNSNRLKLQYLDKIGVFLTRELKRIDDQFFESLADFMESQMDGSTLSKVIETLITEYLKSVSIETKKNILLELIDHPIKRDKQQLIELYVHYSGPQFKKFLQLIAHENCISPGLREILVKLESNCRPMNWNLVEWIIKNDAGRHDGLLLEKEPIGAGTTAQVHRSTYKGKDVVVRITYPDNRERFRNDEKIFKKIARNFNKVNIPMETGLPPLEKVASELTEIISEELDLVETAERQKEAARAEIYSKDFPVDFRGKKGIIRFRVPEVYPVNAGSNVMIQEAVDGHDMYRLPPELRNICSEIFLKLWLDNSLFKSGFFHGDPHLGNFLCRMDWSPKREKFVLNVYLIDYGIGGRVTNQYQTELLKLAIAGFGRETNEILRVVERLSANKLTNKVKSLVRESIEGLLKTTSGPLNSDHIIVKSVNSGVRFPLDFICFTRGKRAVDVMVRRQENGDTIYNKVLQSLIRENPKRLLRAVFGNQGVGIKPVLNYFSFLLKRKLSF
jgi:predicted unusual protein kinase regulating ubiquinone biosynthesis (AarF/ABC1/UbiB family)